MKIIKEGTIIKTVIGDVQGIISGICIRNEQPYYQISYFVNGIHQDCWLYPYELYLAPEKRSAGFNPPINNPTLSLP